MISGEGSFELFSAEDLELAGEAPSESGAESGERLPVPPAAGGKMQELLASAPEPPQIWGLPAEKWGWEHLPFPLRSLLLWQLDHRLGGAG